LAVGNLRKAQGLQPQGLLWEQLVFYRCRGDLNTMVCRLLIDPPAPGPWNMAVDEVLLETAARWGDSTLRFYRWCEPTLSLGYFQQYADRFEHAASREATAVRRLTGGGAILHDHELTYSLSAPAGHPWVSERDRLYTTIHATLIDALAALGTHAALCQPTPAPAGHSEPLLCFQRRAPGDVLIGATKVAGSAQRRRRGAVLQHGSVLLARSAAVPELDGLSELTGRAITADQLLAVWLPLLQTRLVADWQQAELSQQQRREAESLRRDRYAAAAWTEHRDRD
jgi:lipoate-protein ligase A